MKKNLIIDKKNQLWTTVSEGVERKIIAYDENLMLVEVAFEQGAIGAVHQHPHVQITYVKSGIFEVEVDGNKQVLKKGDSFIAPSNVWHGVVCMQAGILLDSFSPMRQDFLQ